MSESTWLSKEFIQRALRIAENDQSINIVDMSVKAATGKGDNYASDMYRIVIEYTHNINTKKKLQVVMKVSLTTEGAHKELIENAGVFEKEMQFMTTILREMELLLGDTKLGGKCIYTQTEKPALLIIEDLSTLGFRMADREAGLDLKHTHLAIRNIAKFHASSIAVYEKTPEYKEIYAKGIFHSDYPAGMADFFINGMKSLANAVAHWPELDKKYSEKLMKLSDVIYARVSETVKPLDSELNVINHGDVWVNNMMFKYNDKGQVIDHIFVDFQVSVYGSPAIDLNYFFNTSPSDEVFFNYKDNLLQEYLEVLTATMKKLNCKASPPSMADLKKTMLRLEIYGFISACTVKPLVMTKKEEAQNLEEIMNGDGFNKNSYQNPAYKEAMLKRLPRWNEMGLLD